MQSLTPLDPARRLAADAGPTLASRLWLWMPLYAALWVLLSLLSAQYWNLPSDFWYLPAGLRLGALWLLPRRMWPLLVATEVATMLPLMLWRDPALPLPGAVAGALLPPLVYALSMLALRPREGARAVETVSGMFTLLLAAIIPSLLSTTLLGVFSPFRPMAPDAVHVILFTHAMRDLLGTLTVTPLLFALLLPSQRNPALDPPGPGTPQRLLTIVLPTLISLAIILPNNSGFVQAITLSGMALNIAAYLTDWRNTAAATTLLSATTFLLHHPPFEHAILIPSQLLLVADSSGALVLAVAAQTLQRARIKADALADESRRKSEALKRAARRLVQIQEDERLRIGQDLHDSVGQSLTALRTRLHLLLRRHGEDERLPELEALNGLVADAQAELRAVVSDIHPVDVRRHGLERALSSGSIAAMLADAGIRYQATIQLCRRPEDDAAITIYRICQEAASNALKAGRCRYFGLSLHAWDADDGVQCELLLMDDGGPLDLDAPAGLGLQGIEDRASALDAAHWFDPDGGMPRHRLVFALDIA